MTLILSRRAFAGGLAAAAAASTLGFPSVVRSQGTARVVVIGGGAGGGTAAKFLARDSGGKLEVTLVQDQSAHTTCFYSNLYLGGLRSFESITHSYGALQANYGIKLVTDRAVDVDPVARTVRLRDGGLLPYDALVMAPGISLLYDSIAGYTEAAAKVMPHAWQAGEQSQILRRQVEAMDDGGMFLLAAPPNPYRCPPGPYERASLVAFYLKMTKPKSKVLVLDAKDKFSKQALFKEAWERHYPGMIEWVPGEFGGKVDSVDPAAMTVAAGGEIHRPKVANIVPRQAAGEIARRAGLADDSGWCPIVPASMASKKAPNIWIVGDACIPGDMPKSAFAANSQAKVAAMTIRHALTGSPLFPPKYRNTCYSSVAEEDVVKVGGNYEAKDDKITEIDSFISKTGESSDVRLQTKAEADGWYKGITKDIFA